MDTAIKHLLHNLHDAANLKVNPLVEHFFDIRAEDGTPIDEGEARARIRRAVEISIDRVFEVHGSGRAHVHLRRQREIIIRCDIGGEADKVVQAAMGLERRQFYREKQRARARLAKALKTLVPAPLPKVVAVPDGADLSLAHFRALRDAGNVDGAIGLLQSLLRDLPDPRRKIENVCRLVECFAENAWWQQAADMLHTAYEISASDAHSRARIAWAKSEVAWFHGAYDTAAKLTQEAIHHLLHVRARNAEDEELLALAYLQLAHCRNSLGLYERALEALKSAREIVEDHPELPVRLKVNFLFHLGGGLASMPGCLNVARRHLEEAFDLATRHGLARDASGTALTLANLYMVLGEHERALQLGRQGLTVSRRVRGAAAHGWYCLSFAGVELAAGNPMAALELARFGGSTEAHDLPRAGLARTVEADALLHMGNAGEARDLALTATSALRSHEHPRILAYALRVFGEAAYRCGDAGVAQKAIIESTELHDRVGHPFSRARALRSRAAITGEVRYEGDARDLLSSLRGA